MNQTVTVLSDRLIEVVSTAEPVSVVETAAVQGPPGPQGPVGPAGGSAVYLAAEALGGHRVVRCASDGLRYADATHPAHAGGVAGITTAAFSAGDAVTLVSLGELVELSWNWTPDAPVFVGANGVLTQTLPAGAAFSQVVGVATSPTSMFVRLREPVTLGA